MASILSMAIAGSNATAFNTRPSFPSLNLSQSPFLPSSSLRLKPFPWNSFSTLSLQKTKTSIIGRQVVKAEAVAEVLEGSVSEASEHESLDAQENEKLGVVVKTMEKPRLVLKFIWMEKNIGLALDQVIPGHGTIPISPYYFWPRKDAWEELKTKLESKPWISQKRMIILLNQATDIINLWQQSGGNLS